MAGAERQDAQADAIDVGSGDDARRIAVLRRPGAAPGILWLGGFRSDMSGSKAEALDVWGAEHGHAVTRLDYSGHGRSGGRFEDGTISRWLEEALAVFQTTAPAPQIVVGSSMGGWLALLLARRLAAQDGGAGRLAGLVLIAPAVDMTQALMWETMSPRQRKALETDGFIAEPSAYSDQPTLITRALIEDGRRHLFGEQPIEVGCPVHVIQGMKDPDVPWEHATRLMEKLAFDDAVLTLVRDGDHRLSRPEDLARLTGAVAAMIEDFSALR